MIPWEQLASAPIPSQTGKLRLARRGEEYSIRVAGVELMNSRMHIKRAKESATVSG